MLTLITPNGESQMAIDVSSVAPQFFTNPDGTVLALHADGSVVSAAAPAGAGETIKLLLTGLGSVNGTAQAGTTPAVPMPVKANVQVYIGGLPARMGSCMIGASYAGVYEVQVQVSNNIGLGLTAVHATADGVPSNSVILPIG
jgi:uncharacterized protein (TIGR03437 family)